MSSIRTLSQSLFKMHNMTNLMALQLSTAKTRISLEKNSNGIATRELVEKIKPLLCYVKKYNDRNPHEASYKIYNKLARELNVEQSYSTIFGYDEGYKYLSTAVLCNSETASDCFSYFSYGDEWKLRLFKAIPWNRQLKEKSLIRDASGNFLSDDKTLRMISPSNKRMILGQAIFSKDAEALNRIYDITGIDPMPFRELSRLFNQSEMVFGKTLIQVAAQTEKYPLSGYVHSIILASNFGDFGVFDQIYNKSLTPEFGHHILSGMKEANSGGCKISQDLVERLVEDGADWYKSINCDDLELFYSSNSSSHIPIEYKVQLLIETLKSKNYSYTIDKIASVIINKIDTNIIKPHITNKRDANLIYEATKDRELLPELSNARKAKVLSEDLGL